VRSNLAPLVALLLASSASAQDVPTHRAFRLGDEDERPAIDGVLDEAIWSRAEPITNFRQTIPVEDADPSEATEVRILVDSRTIFVGVVCFDSDPGAIRATQARRDANLDPDDRIELLFDTFHDRRNAFWFQVGAAGSRGDALLARNGAEFNKQWDGIWHGRARITERGWEAEIEIPAASINFDPTARTWGFNVRRHIRRRSEEVRWASPSPRIRFFWPANAGNLEGIDGLEQGIGLDVKPFGVADSRYTDGDDDLDLDAGIDLFYRYSPDSKVSVSINTDFAETEADSRRVNLTRFPLFFPEKRDFFLEDSGNFLFGGGGGRHRSADVLPFFSRRIGIDGDGNEVPLHVAAKLTGRVDSLSYGFLDVQTSTERDLDARNLSVGRISKNVFEQSDVGMIWTHGDPTGTDGNDTYGADFNYRTDRFLGDRNLQVSTYALKTDTDGIDSDDHAYYASVAYPNDEVDLRASCTVIEHAFDPALGFVPRRGIKKYTGGFSWQPRLNTSIRRLGWGIYPTLITDTGNRTESAQLFIQPLRIEWESGDELSFLSVSYREVLEDDFEIRDGIVIPDASYESQRFGVRFESSAKRELSGEIDISGGEWWDGTRSTYKFDLDWRPSAAATFGCDYDLSDVSLGGGDFEVNVVRARADFQFGPDLAWMNYVQWDDQSDFLGLNSRIWWIPKPGTELFLVLNQGWTADARGFAPEDRQTILKVGTTFRF